MPTPTMAGWKQRAKTAWNTLRGLLIILRPGNVSLVHYYEARERYFSLKQIVEHEKGLITEGSRDSNQERSWKTLLLCEKILRIDERLLTRRQDNVNRLWRSLTRLTVLLINNVWTEKQLAAQLNVCREEAYRLRIEDDPAVASFLQQIAEIIDESGDLGDRKPRVKRALVAAWERFNSIRTRRIHDQHIMSKTYMAAFFFLIVISFMIISNYELITRDWDHEKDVLQNTQIISVQNGLVGQAIDNERSTLSEVTDPDVLSTAGQSEIATGSASRECFRHFKPDNRYGIIFLFAR